MQKKQAEDEKAMMEGEREQQEMAMKQAQTQAFMQGIATIADQLNQLSNTVAAAIEQTSSKTITMKTSAGNVLTANVSTNGN
jgi:hypothetical protein